VRETGKDREREIERENGNKKRKTDRMRDRAHSVLEWGNESAQNYGNRDTKTNGTHIVLRSLTITC